MTKQATILIVDDDVRLLRFVRANLESVDYRVLVAEEGTQALALMEKEMPDLAILDIMLPGMDGFELCRRIREFSTLPIIMLTAKAEESDKIRGFKLGADDYLTKPFSALELLARVEAVLRRARLPEERKNTVLTIGELSIDFVRRRVTMAGKEVDLTPTEYKLLQHLASNTGKVMLHEDLLTKVWGVEYRDELDYLRAYIRRLRQKIEADPTHPVYLLAKPGVGYILVAPAKGA
ncbi:MAG: response regulator transcription factor [Chloroflexi bacterium]|nr:response regulator transcription factor [Chloroflexota bacterium]